MLRLDDAIADFDGIAVDELGAVAEDVDAALGQGLGQRFGMPSIIVFSRSISLVQSRLGFDTAMPCTWA